MVDAIENDEPEAMIEGEVNMYQLYVHPAMWEGFKILMEIAYPELHFTPDPFTTQEEIENGIESLFLVPKTLDVPKED